MYKGEFDVFTRCFSDPGKHTKKQLKRFAPSKKHHFLKIGQSPAEILGNFRKFCPTKFFQKYVFSKFLVANSQKLAKNPGKISRKFPGKISGNFRKFKIFAFFWIGRKLGFSFFENLAGHVRVLITSMAH